MHCVRQYAIQQGVSTGVVTSMVSGGKFTCHHGSHDISLSFLKKINLAGT